MAFMAVCVFQLCSYPHAWSLIFLYFSFFVFTCWSMWQQDIITNLIDLLIPFVNRFRSHGQRLMRSRFSGKWKNFALILFIILLYNNTTNCLRYLIPLCSLFLCFYVNFSTISLWLGNIRSTCRSMAQLLCCQMLWLYLINIPCVCLIITYIYSTTHIALNFLYDN
jgi:hypothetical protein